MPSVATCILMDEKGQILILKRSNKVGTYKGFWSGVAGYVEKGEKPIDTAFKEIREETGLNNNDVELIKTIEPIEVTDFYEGKRYDWKIYPFLFKTGKKSKVQIDWEHTKYRWIKPSELESFEAVPRLKEVVLKLLK
jgi:8-oxo-dGTP pyrophosphatase MutT (NUDIX family)